jgi:hypothetical protein
VFYYFSCYVLDFACKKDLLISHSFNKHENTYVHGIYTSKTSIFSVGANKKIKETGNKYR